MCGDTRDENRRLQQPERHLDSLLVLRRLQHVADDGRDGRPDDFKHRLHLRLRLRERGEPVVQLLLDAFRRQLGSVRRRPGAGQRVAGARDELTLRVAQHLGPFKIRVEHDDREGQDEGGVCRREDLRILEAVALGELLHHPVNFLRFSGQAEARQVLADRFVHQILREVHHLNVGMEHTDVEAPVVLRLPPKIIADRSLAQLAARRRLRQQESGNVLRILADDALLLQEGDASRGLEIELRGGRLEHLVGLLLLLEDFHDRSPSIAVGVLLRGIGPIRASRGASVGELRSVQAGLGRRSWDVDVVHVVLVVWHSFGFSPDRSGGLLEALEDGVEPPQAKDSQLPMLLGVRRDHARVGVGGLAHLGESEGHLLEQVSLVEVAVVVDEHLEDPAAVGADVREHLEHQQLVLESAVLRIEDAHEDVGHEELDLRLALGLEVVQDRQEELQGSADDRRHAGRTVSEQRRTEVVLHGENEAAVRLEGGAGVLEGGQQQLQGELLRGETHDVRPEEVVPGSAIAVVVHIVDGQAPRAELAQCAKHQEAIPMFRGGESGVHVVCVDLQRSSGRIVVNAVLVANSSALLSMR
eukprot:scaffold1642_cov252-Pinguiococcus_pyrenoidosus.AAC.2